MKYSLTFLILFVFTSNVFSQECDDTTRARMIKSGISDKAIEEQCGKIGKEEKVSEKIEKTEDDLKISDESKKPYQAQIILLSSLGSGISLYYYLSGLNEKMCKKYTTTWFSSCKRLH